MGLGLGLDNYYLARQFQEKPSKSFIYTEIDMLPIEEINKYSTE